MRDYIILNGKNSNEIDGLLIQILPPISKPLMRNTIETIDGKDGDQITKLGYSAYNKQVSVGLYGDFDINEVIKYFDSEGKIIFSNESDKFYYYTILDQIDFEKLIRFRTATVTFHVQPFKYPVEEEPIDGQFQFVTGTGSNISLDNTANSLFNKLDLKGNTEQNGTPTPAAPVDIEVVTGENTINVVGKNLLNIDSFTLIRGTSRTASMVFSNTLNAGTYTISWNVSNQSGLSSSKAMGWDIRNLSNTAIVTLPNIYEGITTNYYTFTTNEPFNKIYAFINSSADDSATITIENMQIERGSTATPYTPYQSQSYTIDFGDLEFCGFEGYKDYPYKLNGKWYKHSEIGKHIFSNSDRFNPSGTNYYFVLTPTPLSSKAYINTYSYDSRTSGFNNMENYHFGFETSGVFHIKNTTVADASALIQNLVNTSSYLLYVLATPTETEITDENLIEQLENLKLATSYEGQTNISHEYSNAPIIFDVSAVQLGSDNLIIDNIGNIYSRPTLNLEGTGVVNIYLEENQMFQVDMSQNNNIVIDTNKMEAYDPNNMALMNRKVVGNYNNFKLNAGENTLKFSGDLTNIEVTNYVRWL